MLTHDLLAVANHLQKVNLQLYDDILQLYCKISCCLILYVSWKN